MINSEPATDEQSQADAVNVIVASGARGAVLLAGIATATVIALWVAFYLLIFVPRGPVP